MDTVLFFLLINFKVLIVVVCNISESLGQNLEVLKASTSQYVAEQSAQWDKKQQEQLRAEKERLIKDVEVLCEKLLKQDKERSAAENRNKKEGLPAEDVEGLIAKKLREERDQWEKERAKKEASSREKLEEFWKKELSHQQEEFFNKRKEWESRQQKERQHWENEQKKKFLALEQQLQEKLEEVSKRTPEPAKPAPAPKHEGKGLQISNFANFSRYLKQSTAPNSKRLTVSQFSNGFNPSAILNTIRFINNSAYPYIANLT